MIWLYAYIVISFLFLLKFEWKKRTSKRDVSLKKLNVIITVMFSLMWLPIVIYTTVKHIAFIIAAKKIIRKYRKAKENDDKKTI